MKRKIIKLLSVVLTCAAISSTSAMAATTNVNQLSATVNKLSNDKVVKMLHGKNLDQAIENLKKQFSEINSNVKINSKTGFVTISNQSDNISQKAMSLNDANTPIPLTDFGIASYGSKAGYYTEPNGIINKTNLPLDCLVCWAGNPARITSVTVDGNPTNSYEEGQMVVLDKNAYGTPTEFAEEIYLNNNFVSNLPNGMHTISITCSSENKWTVGGNTISDSCTFNLEN